MEWDKSYTSSWRVFRVNRKTWADAEEISNVDSVNISRTADGSLLESGKIEITGELDADYYRVVMTAVQGGDIERVDVATLLFDVSNGKKNYKMTVQEAEGHSVLYPASTATMLAGEYAPAGVDGADYAAQLLREHINAPIEVEGSFVLNDHVVHEIGSTILEAVWAVLDAGGYVIQITGRGIVRIVPKPTAPALVISNDNASLLTNEVSFETDESEIPNRYIVIDGINRTIAVNDDPESRVSTVNRGFYIDIVDESPTPVNGETLSAYAQRKLKEASVITDRRSYKREYADDVYLYSIVRATLDGLDGDLRVESQSIDCSYGITVSEKATKEIQLL